MLFDAIWYKQNDVSCRLLQLVVDRTAVSKECPTGRAFDIAADYSDIILTIPCGVMIKDAKSETQV